MRGIVIAVLLAACGGSGSGGGGGGEPLTQDELVTGCVLFGSCIGGDGINDCFTDVAPIVPVDAWRCMIAAGSDCTASRACFGFSVATVTSCTERCDGDTTVQCDGNVELRTTCGSPFAPGPHCSLTNFGQPECNGGTCTDPSHACDGTVAQLCDTDTGTLEVADCADFALDCVNGACTAPGGGGTCVDGTPSACSGTAIQRCESGTTALFDCPSRVIGSTCIAGTATSDTYCGYDTACVPEKGTETCTGTTVNFCAAGVAGNVDCTSLGFTQCLNGRCLTL